MSAGHTTASSIGKAPRHGPAGLRQGCHGPPLGRCCRGDRAACVRLVPLGRSARLAGARDAREPAQIDRPGDRGAPRDPPRLASDPCAAVLSWARVAARRGARDALHPVLRSVHDAGRGLPRVELHQIRNRALRPRAAASVGTRRSAAVCAVQRVSRRCRVGPRGLPLPAPRGRAVPRMEARRRGRSHVAAREGHVRRGARALGAVLLASLRITAWAEALDHAPPVELIVTAPADPSGVPRDRVPSNTVFITGEAFEERPGAGIAEVIASRSGSAFVTFPQGSPYQAQFTFRGYGVSSLLGMPQGLSVYLDGVRVNSTFGDGIDWALLPRTALDDATIVPGSNPLFGANTLGGTLVLRTKSGDTSPGVEADAYMGSFGRRGVRFEAGGAFDGRTHAYIGGSVAREDGWRDHSPSDVKEVFAKVGRRGPAGEAGGSLAAANANPNGHRLAPPRPPPPRPQPLHPPPHQT